MRVLLRDPTEPSRGSERESLALTGVGELFVQRGEFLPKKKKIFRLPAGHIRSIAKPNFVFLELHVTFFLSISSTLYSFITRLSRNVLHLL